MTNTSTNIDSKIKNNAIIAYLFIFVNITFLFSKKNELVNNSFVRAHTKTAVLIHIWFLINTVIFAYIWLGFNKEFIGYSISDFIAIAIYLILCSLMVIWMYKANKSELFKLWETLSYKNNKNLLDITSDWKFNEKDKVTIILSKVPFLWFFTFPKYKKNKIISNNTKLSLYITTLIIIFYIIWNNNLANLLLLIYIIFIVFSAINLFVKNEVININTEKLLFWNEIIKHIKTFSKYMWNYFSSKTDFIQFSDVSKQIDIKEKETQENENKELNKLKDFKLWKYIIYIPIINLICFFDKNSKQKIHITNWILISIALIILASIYWIENKYSLLLIIPIAFGLWNLNSNILNYKIPFLYDIFEVLVSIKNMISNIFGKFKKIKNTKKEVNLKVSEDKEVVKTENKEKVILEVRDKEISK